jgi:ATP-dependent DNA helicase RecG
MTDFLHTPISFLKGVGPKRAELLQKELSIFTFGDLLEYFPFRYIDRSTYNTVSELNTLDGFAQLRGYIISMNEVDVGKRKRLTAKFQDRTGQIELVWFQGIKWIKPLLKANVEYQVYGKAKFFGSSFNIPHPELVEMSQVDAEVGLKGIYRSTEKLSLNGLHSKGIEKLVSFLAMQVKGVFQEPFPPYLLEELNLLNRELAIKQVHCPQNEELMNRAIFRLKFEELFFLQMELLLRKQIALQKNRGFIFPEVGNHFTDFYENHLPFELTGAQKRVVKEIRMDFKKGFHMNRLLQGDVGSGKTLVALLTMLLATGNGFQCALMAPTEILAQQHFETISDLVKDLEIRVEKLTGSVRKSKRKTLHEDLESGKINMLIGTHALIEPTVVFQNLGLVVIDEQHRFGVAQRAKLWAKNSTPPHILVMTATPIPRTLAMTAYGDLDVSVIDELPPGRKPITTRHHFEKDRLLIFGFIQKEIDKGRQVYVVFPLIKESETLDYHNLMEGYESISRVFPMPKYQISIVHGQLKPDVKEFEMKRFVNGETQIMVATTVIEVGVNVPNASIMIVESAERFGLSQLHQLRGRVGRGAEQSYCILMTGNKLSKESKRRLATMVETQDGFQIAEVDLELRGPGDLMGTQQSGILDLKIADLATDGRIVALSREKARAILEKDPNLDQPENAGIRNKAVILLQDKPNWSKIS